MFPVKKYSNPSPHFFLGYYPLKDQSGKLSIASEKNM
jgi:hypothetical protein